jgi:hypothetical protein
LKSREFRPETGSQVTGSSPNRKTA